MASVRKIPCTVSSVTNHGGQVYSVRLEPQERLPRFSSGQFLHLTLDPYDPASFWPESRVFSIASSPGRIEPLEILYSVKGRYTARMEQELKPGKEVWVKLPYGEFVLDDLDKPRVLFAGGTGISAFTSLLNAIHQSGRKAPVTLVYGIRDRSLFFYQELVESLANEQLCDQILLFVENGDLPDGTGCMSIHSGRIDFETVGSALSDKGQDYYLAGPPAMLTALKDRLQAQGIPAASVYVDEWE